MFEIHHLQSEVDDMHGVLHHIEHHGCIINSDDVKTSCNMKSHYGTPWLKHAEEFCAFLSLAIVSVFMFENALRIVGKGRKYFEKSNRFQHFELLFETISWILEYRNLGGAEGHLVVSIGRLWRFARIGEGVFEAQKNFISGALHHHK